jgi:D-serine deaminase-like pyridoxal phosphate-dependent protein
MMRPAWLLLALFLATAALAEPPVDVTRKPAPKAKPAAKAKAQARPAWAELTAEQQKTLAPLKADWESLEPERRRKWIGIAKRYPAMKVAEQERVQRRMQAWAKLSPEQRRQARETYKQIVKVPPEKRGKLREQWAEYQQLPPQERESLTSEPRRKK